MTTVTLRFSSSSTLFTSTITTTSTGAAQLQRQMTEHTLKTAKSLQEDRNIIIEIHFAGGNEQLMRQWLGTDVEYLSQVAGDLGNKMRSAFECAFDLGSERVVTIGIDCPDTSPVILNQAFEALTSNDLVLGGAEDGGYYLIGLSKLVPELFSNINWGTDSVFATTQAIAQRLELAIAYLPTLRDLDRPEDLEIATKHNLKFYRKNILKIDSSDITK